MKKRDLLKTIGASIFATGLGSAAGSESDHPSADERPFGTGGPGNDDRLPVYAAGTMTHEYERRGDLFVRHKTFRSPALRERYGDPVMEYEPERLHERQVPAPVREGRRTTVSGRTRRVIGTVREHGVAETHLWNRVGDDVRSAIPDLDDAIPLYHYESASDAGDKQDRKAPINVSWDWAGTSSIESWMESGTGGPAWTQILPLPEEPRYVNDDGVVRSTDAHVMNSIAFCPMTQYHIRLYDVDVDGVDAVGQAHRDPCNHNKGIEIDDWAFDETRSEVDSWWDGAGSSFDTTTVWVGNTDPDWGSHGGYVAHVSG